MITRADDPDDHPFEPYDAATAPAEKLWAELSNPSWERRLTAHTEILRRGGSVLAEAANRLADVKADDPAPDPSALAGGGGGFGERRGEAAVGPRPGIRVRRCALQAVRALASVPWRGRRLRDVREGAWPTPIRGCSSRRSRPSSRCSTEPPLDPVVRLACGPDDYLRQTATRLLARKAGLEHIVGAGAIARTPAVRLAGVLAAGVRLTVPPSDFTPPEQVKLTYPADGAFFKVKIHYADGEADMRVDGPRRQLHHRGILESHRTGSGTEGNCSTCW